MKNRIHRLGMMGSICMALCLVSCGRAEQPEISGTPEATLTAEPTMMLEPEVTPTPIPKTAKKTLEECFRGWMYDETPEEIQAEYYRKEYDGVRYDRLADWKDVKGNYCAPKGYKIEFHLDRHFQKEMASQQMPPVLLEEMGTEDLYQLIMNLPVESWGTGIKDTYLQILSGYYERYNFMTEFMRRKDASKVVHRYYKNFSKKERKEYNFSNRASLEATEEEWTKAERFWITEGLEWLFLYKEGKKVPDERVFGLGVGAHY